MRQLISEMAQPLTIGSFTTIGAFSVWCLPVRKCYRILVGLPRSLLWVPLFFVWSICRICWPWGRTSGSQCGCQSFPSLRGTINSFHLERSKVLVGLLLVVALVGFALSHRVSFDSDMNSLSYQPPKFDRAEKILNSTLQKGNKNIYFVAVGSNEAEAIRNYSQMNNRLGQLAAKGKIKQYASAQCLLVDAATQRRPHRPMAIVLDSTAQG